MFVGQFAEFTAGSTALVVHFDGIQDGIIGDFMAADFFQMAFHFVVGIIGELLAGCSLTNLGMSQENNGHLVLHGHFDVLAHGTQGVAQNRGDDPGQAVQGPVQQHFQGLLSQGAVEGSTVFLGTDFLLAVAAPYAHGNHACSIDQFFRHIVRHAANGFFALGFIVGQHGLRAGRYFFELFNKCTDSHCYFPFFSSFASMASTKP